MHLTVYIFLTGSTQVEKWSGKNSLRSGKSYRISFLSQGKFKEHQGKIEVRNTIGLIPLKSKRNISGHCDLLKRKGWMESTAVRGGCCCLWHFWRYLVREIVFLVEKSWKTERILQTDICVNHVPSFITSSFYLVQIRGSLRVILRPLIPAAPLVGGVSVFFLNRPVSCS